MADTTRSILQSAKRFFAGTMLSRLSGFARDVAMAMAFGTQETVAAFLLAFRLAHLFRRVLGEGALQSAFIPFYEKIRSQNPGKALAFFQKLTLSLSVGLLFLISLLMVFLLAIKPHLSFSNQEVVEFTFWMLPSLAFICLFGINAALLQCQKKYFLVGVAPVAFNVCWIAGVLCLREWPIEEAMKILCGIVIMACLAQWIVTLPGVWQTFRQARLLGEERSSFSFNELRFFIKPLLLGVLGISASQINNTLDAIFARFAENEGPAYLWYAIRVQQLPLALFGLALSGALLPPLSRALKEGNLARFRGFLNYALQSNFILMIPLTCLFMLGGESLIKLLFGRGSFNAFSIAGTTACLWGYTLGLLPTTTILILGPAFYAHENFRATTWASLLALGINCTLNTLFIFIFGWGAFSIAIATSISAWINMGYLFYSLRVKVGFTLDRAALWTTLRVLLCSLISAVCVYWGKWRIELDVPHPILQIPLLEWSLITLSFCVFFLLGSYLLKISLSRELNLKSDFSI